MRWSHPDLGVKLQKSLHSYIKVWNRVLQQSEIESEMISILFGITPEIISFQFLKRPLLNRRAKIWELTKRKIEGDTKWLQSLPRDYNHDHNRVSVRLIRGQPWPLWAPPGLRQEAGAKVRPHQSQLHKRPGGGGGGIRLCQVLQGHHALWQDATVIVHDHCCVQLRLPAPCWSRQIERTCFISLSPLVSHPRRPHNFMFKRQQWANEPPPQQNGRERDLGAVRIIVMEKFCGGADDCGASSAGSPFKWD